MSRLLYIVVCSVLCLSDSIYAMRSRSGSIEVNSDVQKKIYLSRNIFQEVFKESHISFDSPELYTFVFNVGQGNFCLMRKNNKIVIVDAGKGNGLESYVNITKEFLNPFFAKSVVEAVFITHPHDDHFDLFFNGLVIESTGPRGGKHKKNTSLLDEYPDSFQETCFWLGGTQEDWKQNESRKGVIRKIESGEDREIRYVDIGHESSIVSLLDNVDFHILGIMPLMTPKRGEENKLSLIIQASFNGKNIIFLGDSEGESVDRLKGTSTDIRPLSFVSKDTEIEGRTSLLYKKIDELIREKISSFLKRSDPNLWVTIANIESVNEEYWKLCDTLSSIGLCSIQSFLPESVEYEKILAESKEVIGKIERYNELKEELESTKEELETARSTIKEDERRELQVEIEELKREIRARKGEGDEEALMEAYAELKEKKEELEMAQDNYEEAIERLAEEGSEKKVEELKGEMEKQTEELQTLMPELSRKYEQLLLAVNKPSMIQDFKRNYKWDESFLGDNWQDWTEESNPMLHLLDFIKKVVFVDYANLLLKMRLFESSQLIVLPHHGTNTENSQRFLGYFSGISGKRTFVISSSPFGGDNLPKRSTLEMGPLTPIHPMHPFLYGRDDYKKGTNKRVSMKITMKPIYVTGAAPGGVYCFKISERFEDKSIYMLNLYGQDSSWFNVLDDYHELEEL